MALHALASLRASMDPDVHEAVAWCEAHLPVGPLVLTHGDLLPQNILIDLDGSIGVIDWQFAGPGDPAADIAVLTRGVKKPFKLSSGLETVVRAYLDEGGQLLSTRDVFFHELRMVAAWVDDGGEEHYRGRLRACLRRARGS
ncbi:MAG: phosphotransferase [Gemmatimonadales bacterium]|nr:phosphotransferase [Gemmatimonadales bacterium]